MDRTAVFDIESRNWIQFEVMGFYDGTDYKVFTSIRRFLQFLNQAKYSGWRILAHNGGKFDFLFLFKDIFNLAWDVRIIQQGSSIISFDVVTDKGFKLSFQDSYKRIPLSLKKAGEAFGVKCQKGEIDYERISKNDPLTLQYLRQDCLSLYQVIEAFEDSTFIVNPKLTIASQALDTFKEKFFEGGTLERLPIDYEDEIRGKYYSGGRVEVFRGYGKGVSVYDVNSLYPFSMLGDMPTGEAISCRTEKPDAIGFYKISVGETRFFIPPFLYRAEGSTKLYFVNGPGVFHVSSATLAMLKRYKVKYSVLSGYYFTGASPLFNDYVHTLYDLKQTSKGQSGYIIFKLLLNSLYGKMGQKREHDSIVTLTPDLFRRGGYYPFDENLNLVLVQEQTRSKWIAPYIAAYITDKARAHHWHLMQKAPRKVLYCDTDSIHTTGVYPTGSGIGQLSCEGSNLEAVYIAPKCYAYRGKGVHVVKFKGFDSQRFTFSDVLKSAKTGKPMIEERERILSFRECTSATKRTKGIIQEESSFLKMVKTTKTTHAVYDKRLTKVSKTSIFTSTPHNPSTIERSSNGNK
jgi:hypothetical protein